MREVRWRSDKVRTPSTYLSVGERKWEESKEEDRDIVFSHPVLGILHIHTWRYAVVSSGMIKAFCVFLSFIFRRGSEDGTVTRSNKTRTELSLGLASW